MARSQLILLILFPLLAIFIMVFIFVPNVSGLTPQPSLVSPSSGPETGGTQITISGEQFEQLGLDLNGVFVASARKGFPADFNTHCGRGDENQERVHDNTCKGCEQFGRCRKEQK